MPTRLGLGMGGRKGAEVRIRGTNGAEGGQRREVS